MEPPKVIHREPPEIYLAICFFLVWIGLMFVMLIQRIDDSRASQTWVCDYMSQRIEINRDGETVTSTSVGFHQACPD